MTSEILRGSRVPRSLLRMTGEGFTLVPQDDGEGFKVAVQDNGASSKPLHPRPHFDLPAPGAARLLQQMQIGLGDRVRIEQRVGLRRILRPPRAADAAVDHDMRDMNALRR